MMQKIEISVINGISNECEKDNSTVRGSTENMIFMKHLCLLYTLLHIIILFDEN